MDGTVRRAMNASVGCIRRLSRRSFPYSAAVSIPYDGSLYGRSSNFILDLSFNPRMAGRRNDLCITGLYDNLVTFTFHLHEAKAYLNSRNEVANQSLEEDLEQESEERALTTSPGFETDG